jgi:hypothetical protein
MLPYRGLLSSSTRLARTCDLKCLLFLLLGMHGPVSDIPVAVFAHASKMEGIVSKHRDSAYRSGRSPDWLKSKNPACAAVKREAEEDWLG